MWCQSSSNLIFYTPGDELTPAAIKIEADRKIVQQLLDFERELSKMLKSFRQQLVGCDVNEARLYLNNLFGTNDFENCDDITKLLDQLSKGYVDTFNVRALEELAICLERDDLTLLVNKYEEKKEEFLKKTTVLDFQRAVVTRTKPVLSEENIEVAIKVHEELTSYGRNKRVLKDMEKLAREAFEDNQKWFVRCHALSGSIIVTWHVPKTLQDILEQLVYEKAAMLREEGVEEVTIGGKIVFHLTELIVSD